MDTIILCDLSVIGKNTSDDLDGVELAARLMLDGTTFDQTELVRRSGLDSVWGASYYFLVPVTSSAFFVAVDHIVEEGSQPTFGGLVEVDCAQVVDSVSSRSEPRYFLIEQKGPNGEETKFDLSFAAFLSTSNVNNVPSPQSVIQTVRSLDGVAIAQLLLQIVSSDAQFIKPCLGLLYTAYQVVAKLSNSDKNKSWCFGMLANIHLARYDTWLNIMGDESHEYPMHNIYIKGLKSATLMLEFALKTSADDYEKRPWLQLSLCMCFQRLLVDQIKADISGPFIATAIQFWDSVKLIRDDEPKKTVLAKFAATVFRHRFEITGSITDLNSCILASEEVVNLTNDESSDKVELLNDLISALLERHGFVEDNQLAEVEKALVLSRQTLSLITNGHDAENRAKAHYNLARSLLLHQQHSVLTSGESLDAVIGGYDGALEHLPSTQGRTRAIWLKELAMVLLQRFLQSDDLNHLDRTISTIDEALVRFSNSPIDSIDCMRLLSRSLFTRFHRCIDFSDLERGMHMLEDAAALDIQHQDIVNTTQYFEKIYDEYVQYFSDFIGAEDAVKSAQMLEQLIEDEGTRADANLRLQSIGTFLALRLQSLADKDVIPENILVVLRKVCKHLTPKNRKTSLWVGMTGTLFIRNFDTTTTKLDIDRAVEFFDDICQQYRSNNVPLDLKVMNLFAISLFKRFRWHGNLPDINRAIDILDNALLECPDGDQRKILLLNNFASSSLERFSTLGDIGDLNNAAAAYQVAIDTTADTDKRASITYNLGHLLLRRLHSVGNIDDADQALSIFQESINNAAEGSAEKVESSIAHSRALLHRFWHLQDSQDLNQSITLLKTTLTSITNNPNHVRRAEILHCLGDAHSQRFAKFGDITDIDESITYYQEAIASTPDTHPCKAMLFFDLGRWLPTRFEQLQDIKDLESSFEALLTASAITTTSGKWRFRAASLRGYWSQTFEYGDAIQSYTIAMELIPKLAWLGLPISNRRFQLLEVGDVVSDAVAAAISANKLDLALNWFEQGRSVIWTQMNILRTPSDELTRDHPDLAFRYEELSKALLLMEQEDDSGKGTYFDQDQQWQRSRNEYHNIAEKRDSLISEIREIGGFHDFLRPKKIRDIVPSSRDGTFVAINMSKFRCDALILLPENDDVVNVRLDAFTSSTARQLKTKLHSLLQNRNALRGTKRHSRRSPFARRPAGDPELEFQDILETLWKDVSKPILDHLTSKKSKTEIHEKDMQRIWWCLSGPLAFLPIHASGLYGPDNPKESKLSDFAVSSYVPSLSILASALNRSQLPERGSTLLKVALPLESNLPFTAVEMMLIQKYQPPFHIQPLIEEDASPENVKSGMKTCDWVHFACHGVHDSDNPEDSALILANESRLTLADITKLEIPHAQFAFLSACQTATGDELLPEESVHLAAGMLSAGYRGVVGTMWSIPDDESPQVADFFYQNICAKKSIPDPSQAAEALHAAVANLRLSVVKKSFFSWVPFIHYGV